MLKSSGIDLTCRDSAALLLSKNSLTEREYKSLRLTLLKQNVKIVPYVEVSEYIKTLDVGTIHQNICNCKTKCMATGSYVHESLEFLLRSQFWYDKFNFMNYEQSNNFFKALKNISSDLYGNLDPSKRTLFVRMTGDNFHASCKYPTEQISYSLLNNKSMLHSPYGQFLSSLWRGNESYENISLHTKAYHQEMKFLLMNGGEFELPNGDHEVFNVVPILCADLGFTKHILGKCSCTGLYGCYYCKKPITK